MTIPRLTCSLALVLTTGSSRSSTARSSQIIPADCCRKANTLKSLSSSGIVFFPCSDSNVTETRLLRHIANETLATNAAGDIYAALHGYFPLVTDSNIRDWINTYASEVRSSEDEKFRTITGGASVRCSVSTTIYSTFPELNGTCIDHHRGRCRRIRRGLDLQMGHACSWLPCRSACD